MTNVVSSASSHSPYSFDRVGFYHLYSRMSDATAKSFQAVRSSFLEAVKDPDVRKPIKVSLVLAADIYLLTLTSAAPGLFLMVIVLPIAFFNQQKERKFLPFLSPKAEKAAAVASAVFTDAVLLASAFSPLTLFLSTVAVPTVLFQFLTAQKDDIFPHSFAVQMDETKKKRQFTVFSKNEGGSSYVRGCKVSTGIFGTKQVALKVFKTKIDGINLKQSEIEKLIGLEISGLQNFKDIPGFIQFKGRVSFYNPKTRRKEKCFITNWIEGNNLVDWYRLTSKEGKQINFRAEKIASVAYQLLKTVKAVHDKGFVYNDLKPANIMVNRKGKTTFIDLGSVRKNGEESSVLKTSSFNAPEYYEESSSYQKNKHFFKGDVWSLGSIFFELIGGKLGSEEENQDGTLFHLKAECLLKHILEENAQNQIEQMIDSLVQEKPQYKGFSSLIKQMLQINPEKRPSIQLCEQKFLKILDQEKIFNCDKR